MPEDIESFGLTLPEDDIKMELLCSCKQAKAKVVYAKHQQARGNTNYVDWEDLDEDEKIIWVKTAFPTLRTKKPKPKRVSLAEMDN